jgi:hypothetical protein
MTVMPVEIEIDEVAVDRAAMGDKLIRLTATEMHAAWQQLEKSGDTQEEIADTLGVGRRSIQRWREGEPVSGRSGMPVNAKKCSPPEQETKRQVRSVTDDLIRDALASKSKRVQAAARAVQKTLAVLAAVTLDEAARDAKRTEIARLETELAQAKAGLRNPVVQADAPTLMRINPPAGYSYSEVWDHAATYGVARRRGRPPKHIVEKYLAAHQADGGNANE